MCVCRRDEIVLGITIIVGGTTWKRERCVYVVDNRYFITTRANVSYLFWGSDGMLPCDFVVHYAKQLLRQTA